MTITREELDQIDPIGAKYRAAADALNAESPEAMAGYAAMRKANAICQAIVSQRLRRAREIPGLTPGKAAEPGALTPGPPSTTVQWRTIMASENVAVLRTASASDEAFIAEMEQEKRDAAAWMPSSRDDSPDDLFDRKFYQAEMLAHAILSEDFRNLNYKIRDGVLWLLADLITEAREAKAGEA